MIISTRMRIVSLAMVCAAALGMAHPVVAGSVHARARSGARGTAVSGGYTRTLSDGTTVHQGGTALSGANGGYYKSTNSYSKSASGAVTGSTQTSAAIAKGTYTGTTSTANGQTTHDATVTSNATGETYNGQTTYTQGQGVTHTGTCTNASGVVVACP